MEATRCPSADECISKLQYIHKVQHRSALKGKGILTCAATWMNVRSLLNEIRQSQKARLHKVLRIVKFIETERRMVVARAWREQGLGSCWVMGTRVSLLQDKKGSGAGRP